MSKRISKLCEKKKALKLVIMFSGTDIGNRIKFNFLLSTVKMLTLRYY